MFIILQREYTQRVKKRSFIISTLLTPILMVALTVVPTILSHQSINKGSSRVNMAVVDDSGVVGDKLTDSEIIDYTLIDGDSTTTVRESGDFNSIIYINKDILSNHKDIKVDKFDDGFTMAIERNVRYSLNSIIKDLKIKSYDIEGLDDIVADANVKVSFKTTSISAGGEETDSSAMINYAIGGFGAIMIYMFIMIYGAQILTSVIDEKSSKIMEIMVSTVSPMQMMMGKILGVGLVAITQFAIWGIFIFLGGLGLSALISDGAAAADTMAMTSNSMYMSKDMLPTEAMMLLNGVSDIMVVLKTFTLFIIFFIGGYLFYAACYASIAAAVDNIQDAQQFQMPVTIPLLAAIMCISPILQNPTSDLSFWLSIIPFTSPIIMVSRISSDIPIWELLLSISLLYASFIGMIWVAGRIYRIGIFVHGRKPSYKELYRWVRYK